MIDISKAGVLIMRNNKFLLCRKQDGTSKLIIPGGSIEPGEEAKDCIIREAFEELGNDIQLQNLVYLGTYQDEAAFDDPTIHKTVQIILYQSEMTGEPIPTSEISELIWFDSTSDKNELSAIIKNKILPDLVHRKILKW